jgi:tetratricopeptide (TPR) repeat protein
LIGFFSYLELSREVPATGSPQQLPPMQFPAMQNPATPPSKEILEAIERLEQTVKNAPTDAGAKLLLANALHDAGTHDGTYLPRAIASYKEYLKAKPGDPNARVDLGICYFELGKIDTTQTASLFSLAIGEMEATLKNNPKHQAGAFNLGIVYLYTGDMLQSNKWFLKAVELNPESDLGKRAKTIVEQHKQAG